MIVYQSTKRGFLEDSSNGIEDIIRLNVKQKLNIDIKPGSSEYESWRNSLGNAMSHVMNTSRIPDDSDVAIEYSIPRSKNRIDFIITGQDENNQEKVIIIELKQWTDIQLTEKDAMVLTRYKGILSEALHPSYQAWSYSTLLNGFNATVYEEKIGLQPCAYLHNHIDSNNVIKNSFYEDYLQKSPAFCKGEKEKLQDFIAQFIKHGDKKNILYRIDHGEIRPSKDLANSLASMLKGNQEFIMIDDQKVVYENALALARKSSKTNKNVLIVEGGPGTGKSVVAINLLVAITKLGLNTQYVTKNSAPRGVFESKLTKTLKKTAFSNMFTGSGSYTNCDKNIFDMLIVDEAHRLNAKSGMMKNLGENQIKEIIETSKSAVFFIDEDQRVTWHDIGSKEEIEKWANKLGSKVETLKLESQFRCNGSDGYLSWIDNTLQVKETANTTLEGINYDFKVMGSPNELREIIFEKNKLNNKARLVAGYCWDWVSKKNKAIKDITIPEHRFAMQWNLASDGNVWIIAPESVNEVGCIHTCQGLEVDYIGVIVGEDFIVRDGKVITDPSKRAKTDASLNGYKKALIENPELAKAKANAIILNTYRTLMTRGMKGCYVYFVDKETERFFRSRMGSGTDKHKDETFIDKIEQEINESLKYVEYLPLYSLEAACGKFKNRKDVKPQGWIKVRTKQWGKDTFVVYAIGNSMYPKISDGDLCIFKASPVGPYTGQGRVYLFEYQGDPDPETGGPYTIKGYRSIKGPDGFNAHIELIPFNKSYEVMLFKPEDEDNTSKVSFVAEFIEVLR
jgi:DUF2075 family protein